MLRATLSLIDIIIAFESTLRIDYTSNNIREIIIQTRRSLDSVFSIKSTQTLEEALVNNKLSSTSVQSLMQQITENLKALALYNQITMFDKEYGKTLKDYKYIGFARERLLAALQYLQDKEYYARRDEFFDDLISGIEALDTSLLKRLMIIMVVLENLGVEVGVSIIAQFLYLGGMVQ